MTFRLADATAVAGVVGAALAVAALSIWSRFVSDLERASATSAQGSMLLETRCGPIEVQQAGAGVPLLVVCLLDALGIRRAAVVGGSAGAPSALEMTLRHPDRVSALVLLVPLAYKPPTQADSAPPMPGGHTWVGHDDEVMAEIVKLLVPPVRP